jgi:hypothetical protein
MSAAEIEVLRKKQLQASIERRLAEMTGDIAENNKGSLHVTASQNIRMSVFAKDNIISGYKAGTGVRAEAFETKAASAPRPGQTADFSALLQTAAKKKSPLESELEMWIDKIDDRILISEKDEADCLRVCREVSAIAADTSVDIEDRLMSVKMRVTNYLRAGAALSEAEKKRLEKQYNEYLTLCTIFEVEARESLPSKVEAELARMKKKLMRQEEEEYTLGVIEDILEELGCKVKGDAVLDRSRGQLYSVEGSPLCDVFIAREGNSIMFEPVGEAVSGSLEQERLVEENAHHVCSLYSELSARAAERGVILKNIYNDPIEMEELILRSDLGESKVSQRQRRRSILKERTME